MYRLYLVTDRHATRGRPLVEVVAAAVRNGVDGVQLREKDLDGGALYRLGCKLREVCHAGGAELLINDRIDVALACGADGVHLPVNSFTPGDARALLGAGKRIGCSAHSLAEAQRSAVGGADFVVLGPVFETPSKRAWGEPLGLAPFAAIARTFPIPVLGIGGIQAANARTVLDHGAAGVAVIGAIVAADDVAGATRSIAAALPTTPPGT
jgi:thiamine-phosphate pyrophosphorylase